MTNKQRPAVGKIVGAYNTEEAVYLKVAVEDAVGTHLGWAKGVKIPYDDLKHYMAQIDRRRNEVLQMTLPWDSPEDDNVRWLPPKP